MRNMSLKMLMATILMVVIAITSVKADYSKELWAKYRVNLIRILQGRFPSKAGGSNIHSTILSILTVPDEARWASNKEYLQEVFASHPLRWDSDFEYIDRTADNKLPELYKKAILQCKNPHAFLAFSKAKVDHFNGRKSYPWHEEGETLASFMNTVRAGKAAKIHFIVEEKSGSVSINSPWYSSTTPLDKAGPFIQQFTPELMKQIYSSASDKEAFTAAADNETEQVEEDDEEEISAEPMSSTTWRRRRRRRAYVPPPPTVIHIKAKKFHMDFKSNGLTGITLRPGAWFDTNFIRANKKCLAPFINKGNKMSLIPKIAWVAYQPHVTLKLSETEWKKVQHLWNLPNTLGMAVGGSFFRHKRYRNAIRSDEAVWNSLSEEQRSFYADDALTDKHSDDVVFKVERVQTNADEEIQETAERADFSVAVQEKIVHAAEDDEVISENEPLSSTTWRRRRRRRRRAPPPPPPPKKVYEKVYTVSFKSTSPYPEVIAVTAQNVAAL